MNIHLGIQLENFFIKKKKYKNLICHDFFTWNFKEWRKYTQAELDYLEKQKNKKEYDDGIVQEALF